MAKPTACWFKSRFRYFFCVCWILPRESTRRCFTASSSSACFS